MNAATSEEITSSRKTDLLAKAINNFSQARQADPKQPAYFAREAQAYLLLYEMDQRRSDLESAFDLANQAIRISRRWSRSYDAQYEVLRASIHASAGNLHKALEDINTRLDRAPRDVEALRDKANYLLKLNRLRESYDVLNQAIAYNPSSPRLYNDRGYLYQRASLMRSACRDWQAAIKLAIAFKSKGSIYAQEGANQIVRARQAYNQNC
jgi:tetratricopeptide (TPR) repeat protein